MISPPSRGGAALPVHATIRPASAWNAAVSDWAAVYASDPTASFFMSPAWVQTWLEIYSSTLADVRIIVFHDRAGAQAVGAAVLTHGTRWLGGIPLRRLTLHTAGEPDADHAAVEQVTLLARPGHETAVRGALAAVIKSRTWDELQLVGGRAETLGVFGDVAAPTEVEVTWRPSYVVDLAKLRAAGATYESALSTNTRQQVRRSLRLYRERGDVTLRSATDEPEARAYFEDLGALHGERWATQGEPGGAFASRVWRTFHERLIARTFASGETQLLRVAAGSETIGLLYVFVARGVVSFYQSGFRYEPDNRLKPGLVTHTLAIQHYLDQGLNTYDFLASGTSGARYKESLSTTGDRMAWAVARRPTARNSAVAAMRRLKRMFRSGRR